MGERSDFAPTHRFEDCGLEMWGLIVPLSSSRMSSKTSLGLKEYLVLLFLVLSLVEDSPASASTMDDCAPQSCGNVKIGYPFWIFGKQPSYCGFPPYNITCSSSSSKDNKTQIPLLTVAGFSIHVKNIYYNNHSIKLALARYDTDDPCALPIINATVDIFPFIRSSSSKQISFLYNCSKELPFYRNTSCVVDSKPVYFSGEYNGSTQLNFSGGTCTLVVAPIMGYFDLSTDVNYTVLLRAGSLLNWTAPDCKECHDSGGQCGYNSSTVSFMCICHDRTHLRKCDAGDSNSLKDKLRKAGLAALAGLVTLACASIFLFYRYKKRRRTASSKYLNRNLSHLNGTEIAAYLQTNLFSYDELMEATDGFDISRELGDGGYGTVYKGKLRDGRTVAVKRLFDKNCRRIEQFTNEVEILSRLRHQNLVNLYGCTSYRSRELLLVYEYIPNGTVADHLHGNRASEKILTWPIRLKIAIETADALAYLHAVDPPIVHRDVKTNNILLDSGFHVKIADFGLSRLFPVDATHVSTAPQGTPGYVDPEYHQCFQLTDKSDVYSFGVVLVELISSKPAIDTNRQRSDINLANMAITKIQNHELDDLVDSDLWHHSDESTKIMITMVAELAFRCLQSDGDMRPPIKEVLDGLRAIESSRYKADKKEKNDGQIQDDAVLMQNIAAYSPDSVAGKWLSQSTTPSTSQ